MNAKNTNILVDSSVWINFFKGDKNTSFVSELLRADRICTNDVILTELLPSMQVRNEKKLINLMTQLSKLDIKIDWQGLKSIQQANLQHGNNNISLADLMIVQNCIQNDLKILTTDKHFGMMSKYIPLSVYGLEEFA